MRNTVTIRFENKATKESTYVDFNQETTEKTVVDFLGEPLVNFTVEGNDDLSTLYIVGDCIFFNELQAVLTHIDNFNIEPEVMYAYLSHTGGTVDYSRLGKDIEYVGQFRNDEDFGIQMLRDNFVIPDEAVNYLDGEKYAKDLLSRFGGYFEYEQYYFRQPVVA